MILPKRNAYYFKIYKKKHCEKCGFVAINPCQLDQDHIKPLHLGGKDVIENIQTLCANCHRLKTLEDQWLKRMTLEWEAWGKWKGRNARIANSSFAVQA